jgi:hypothetical protein
MGEKNIFLLFIFASILIFPLINADVVSINSGGSNEIIISPDENIESFFNCFPKTCTDFGYNCNSWSNDCGGTVNCGSCSSGYTCSSGICTSTGGEETPSGTSGSTSSSTPSSVKITINPREINLKLAINTNQKETIQVTNNGATIQSLSVTQRGLDNFIMLGTSSMTLAPGESKSFDVIFVALDQTGIYTGKILIGGVEILVSLNVKTKLLLFDSNIVILNSDYRISQGNALKTKVELTPLGDKERLDVNLNYIIKNYQGKVYLTKSETLLVENKVDFMRNFDTGQLPVGDYIIGLTLIYPGGTAPSSAHFEVIRKTPEDIFATIIFFLILLILAITILIVALLIIKNGRRQ